MGFLLFVPINAYDNVDFLFYHMYSECEYAEKLYALVAVNMKECHGYNSVDNAVLSIDHVVVVVEFHYLR